MAATAAAKRRLRVAMRALRVAAHRPWHGMAAAAILEQEVLPALPPNARRKLDGYWVAGYWPMPGEADPLPALRMLADRGWQTAFPDVVGAEGPSGAAAGDLVFRGWPLRRALPPAGAFGIPAPPATEDAVDPGLVLVPLLAADARGGRLGQGAGFYDRALSRLRMAVPGLLAVGWAQECQLLRAVPTDERDAPLDWIVTERRAIRCPAGERPALPQQG